ncbi:uncharacterized protein [Nicotiana sylvestris]|uniref:High mobility group nucleosome-binding domain-containing protein 5-like n=1 Tax=Nicotiana tabacum TaxID=4097 RepID=A0A1S3ZEP1_TOBAC|nr:PREDICTED: high mobility group nucleosome-binding domain-containing protein 5-like [Nicotiana tabacum]
MFNPQDHLGTPPPPSPSNASSTTPPSESPKPRFRRQKMLARKTVASGALRKVLKERFKASQVKEIPAQNSDSSSETESFQSATEGDGHGSSDFEKTQEFPIEKSEKEKEREGACGEERGNGKGAALDICGVAQENDMKSGGSGSSEAAEGLIHLSKRRDEPVSSTEETLADLLKKVGASYDPKKLPRGRATRSRVKQSEADLQKALEESNKKKKKKDKGKGKIAESSEAVEEEGMELVHQERGTYVEVPTPKPKKPKTSSKKSSSVPVAAEPSLAKRTRSTVKAKQTKVSDDEDWSGEEEENESEKEQDKLAIFCKRKILKGRLWKDLVEPGMMRLIDCLVAQGWKDMVLQMEGRLARNELVDFMANAAIKDGVVSSQVKGVQVHFDAVKLGEILDTLLRV